MTSRRRESHRAGAASRALRSTGYRHLVNPFEPVRIFLEGHVESSASRRARHTEEGRELGKGSGV